MHSPDQPATALDAALRYADHGWPVFPCNAAKRPLNDHGFLEATTDAATIDAWWRRWPHAQIGVACGDAGLCVIDLDFDPGKQKNGPASFARLCQEMGEHGCGLIASTPRGGAHYYYLMPSPGVTSGANIAPGSGIDVRAGGGYVIVPSPVSAGREWVLGDLHSIGPMPEWLRVFVTSRNSRSAATTKHHTESTVPMLPSTVESIRKALAWIESDDRETWIRVGMGLRSTCAGEQAYEIWCEWSATSAKFDPIEQRRQWNSLHEYLADASEVTVASLFWMARQRGMTETVADASQSDSAEIATTASRIGREAVIATATAASRFEEQFSDEERFPAHLLDCPGLVGEIARWILDTSTRPQPALALASSITTVGAILGRRVRTESNLRTNIYALGIGETGCGKDPGISRPASLLAFANLEHLIGPGEWKSDSGLRSALRERMSQTCYIDEFVKVLRTLSGERVPPHLSGIKRALLELFSRAGGTWQATAYADTKVHPAEPLHEPHLCVYGVGVPDDFFGAMDRGAVSDGFLNRFLCFFVDDHLPARRRVSSESVPAAELVERIRAVDDRTAPDGNLAGIAHSLAFRSGARLVPFLGRAQAMVETIERENEERIRAMQATKDPLANVWNRFAEHVQKLALLRAASDDRTRDIGEPDIAWAFELVGWCMRRTHVLARAHLSSGRVEADLKRVLRIIEEGGADGISASALTRRTQFLRRAERKDILVTLAEGHQIVVDVQEGSVGRPSTTYRSARFLARETGIPDAAPQSAISVADAPAAGAPTNSGATP